jgi:hypothetical protein
VELADVVSLPSCVLSDLIRPGSYLAKSSLFGVSFGDIQVLDDDYVRQNLRYLAPAAAGPRFITKRNDVYSFGVLAFKLLTGRLPDGSIDPESPSHVDLLADVHKHITTEVSSPYEVLLQSDTPVRLPPRALSDIVAKCLCRDPDDRYGSLDSLRFDLRRLGQICKAEGNLDRFIVGDSDRQSRFRPPTEPIHRDAELRILQQAWKIVRAASDNTGQYHEFASARTVNVWGLSGCGKTRLVQSWVRGLDKVRNVLVGSCKLDEFSSRPISSFLQIFQHLLDRTLADPEEDPKFWIRRIREALGQQFSVFHNILPAEYRRLLLMGAPAPAVEPIDWSNFLPAFRLWSARLLQIFATFSRPLILVVDDLQWMRPDEVDLWRSLTEGSHPLSHVLIISIYRVQSSDPPPTAHLISSTVESLHVENLPEVGVQDFIENCFSAGVDGVRLLTSLLYAETGGSPLYLRSLVEILVSQSI